MGPPALKRAFVATVLFSLAAFGAPQSARATAVSPRWKVDSPFVRDVKGRAVFWHGVNAVWKRPPYYPPSSWYGTPRDGSFFDRRDARFLRASGLNSVRLGVLFAGVEPKRDVFDERYLDRIEKIVDELGRHGITVQLDFHQDMYNERYEGEGFPEWATLDDGIPATNCCGFPGNYFTPAASRAFDNLWANTDGLWDEYRDAWSHVAERFKDKGNVIGYDLLNEPWPGSRVASCAQPIGCPEFDTQQLQPFFEHVIAGIRSVDPNGIIWWDANVITNNGTQNHVGSFEPIADPSDNTGISFHQYCLVGSPSTGVPAGSDPACPTMEALTFANQREAAQRNDSSWFLTEFGASDDLIDIERKLALADANMVSWLYWHYGDWDDPTTTGTGGTQGLFEDDLRRPGSLKQEKANTLIRTYPQFVAGTPVRFGFDTDTNTFEMAFEADASIRSPTVVFVPVARHYTNGYEVHVEGPARIRFGGSQQYVRLFNTGNGPVTITIKEI